MTANVLPFAPLPEVRRIKELERLLTDTEARLGEAHEALLRAKDVITSLQEEKSYREFYQWLSTERLKDIMDLEQDVKRLERELHERG
jgi:hypothetical protein